MFSIFNFWPFKPTRTAAQLAEYERAKFYADRNWARALNPSDHRVLDLGVAQYWWKKAAENAPNAEARQGCLKLRKLCEEKALWAAEQILLQAEQES